MQLYINRGNSKYKQSTSRGASPTLTCVTKWIILIYVCCCHGRRRAAMQQKTKMSTKRFEMESEKQSNAMNSEFLIGSINLIFYSVIRYTNNRTVKRPDFETFLGNISRFLILCLHMASRITYLYIKG